MPGVVARPMPTDVGGGVSGCASGMVQVLRVVEDAEDQGGGSNRDLSAPSQPAEKERKQRAHREESDASSEPVGSCWGVRKGTLGSV